MAHINTVETTVQKTHQLLDRLTLAHPSIANREHAYEVLKAVLTTLRDRLTPELAHSLGAQLTPLLRGIYYEHWSPGSTPIKMDKVTFIRTIEAHLSTPYEGSLEDLIDTVMTEVGLTIDPAEIEKLKTALPGDIATLFP